MAIDTTRWEYYAVVTRLNNCMDRRTLSNFITEAHRRRYAGKPLEMGGTSIQGAAAPAIRWLSRQGSFQHASKILDFGAGKYARNANWLRQQGFRVYAFDPFNGDPSADGWEGVSTKIPRVKFDVGFTSFVLNVVPEHIEREIIAGVAKSAKIQYHIVRNMDVFALAKKSLAGGNNLVTDFFMKEFATPTERKLLQAGQLDDKTIMAFAEFGFQTSHGFQRIPTSDDLGLTLIKKTSGWKVYQG